MRLEGKKPPDRAYPKEVKTIGDALRKRRLELRLRQADASEIIGCTELTIVNWEKGYTNPRIKHMARVIKFLGYNPLSKGTTLAERIVSHRNTLGITQRQFAHQIGADPATLARWERGEREPQGAFKRRIELLFRPSQICDKAEFVG